MQKLTLKIKVIGTDDAPIVVKEFDSYKEFLAALNELGRQYDILNETTVSCIEVQRRPDLFSQT